MTPRGRGSSSGAGEGGDAGTLPGVLARADERLADLEAILAIQHGPASRRTPSEDGEAVQEGIRRLEAGVRNETGFDVARISDEGLETEVLALAEALEAERRGRDLALAEMERVRAAAAERERAFESQRRQRANWEARIEQSLGSLSARVATVGPQLRRRDAELSALRSRLAHERSRNGTLEEALRRERERVEQWLPRAEARAASLRRTAARVPGPAAAEPAAPPARRGAAPRPPAAFRPMHDPGGATAGSWLARALPTMARHDPVAAGHLVVQLLPAHALILDRRVDYDVSVAEIGRFGVTVGDGHADVVPLRAPRPPGVLDFELEGDAAGLARLVAGAPASRLRRCRRVRVRGRPGGRAPLPALGGRALGLAARAGLSVSPILVYGALRWAVDPAWTRGQRFCVLHDVTGERAETCYVAAVDGGRLEVGLQAQPVTATCRTPDRDFLALLAGMPAHLEVDGHEPDLLMLWEWARRADGARPSGRR